MKSKKKKRIIRKDSLYTYCDIELGEAVRIIPKEVKLDRVLPKKGVKLEAVKKRLV